MQALLTGLSGTLTPDSAIGARILSWPGDSGPGGDAVALRLAGGLHGQVLAGQDADLAAAYPGGDTQSGDGALAAQAALRSIAADKGALMGWLDSPPQTNELRRSGPLVAAAHLLAARFGLPLVLSELGASGGLNLLWDHCALTVQGQRRGAGGIALSPDWDGPLPPDAPFAIAARAGVDLRPADPVADRLRLLAYLWPDQPERIARTRAALDIAARLRPPVAQGDAADWLAQRLAQPHPGAVHVVFHTVAWQYFPPRTQAACHAALHAAGARATPQAPLVHLWMETDGQPDGAALGMTVWPGGQSQSLGRACFHGRWLRWTPPLGGTSPAPATPAPPARG